VKEEEIMENLLKIVSRKDIRRSLTEIMIIWLLVIALVMVALKCPLWLAALIATVVWGYVVCCTPTNKLFFVELGNGENDVAGVNLAMVTARRFASDNGPRNNRDPKTLMNMGPDPNMSVHWGPGIIGLSLFEKPFRLIDCSKAKMLVEAPIQILTKNGISGEVTVKVFATVIRNDDAIINLARQDPTWAFGYLGAQFRAFIISKCRTVTDEELVSECFDDPDDKGSKITGLAHLQNGFRNLFEGPDKISPTEWQLGLFTGNPIITDIKLNQKVLEAKLGVEVAKQRAAAIKELTGTGVDPDVAANMVGAESGFGSMVNVIKITGGTSGTGSGNQGLGGSNPATPLIIMLPPPQTERRK
jgi:hypothetical protein